MDINEAKKRKDGIDEDGHKTIDINPDNEAWDMFVDANVPFFESIEDSFGKALRTVHQAGLSGGTSFGMNVSLLENIPDDTYKDLTRETMEKQLSRDDLQAAASLYPEAARESISFKKFAASNPHFFASLSSGELSAVKKTYSQGFSCGIRFGFQISRNNVPPYTLQSPEAMLEECVEKNPQSKSFFLLESCERLFSDKAFMPEGLEPGSYREALKTFRSLQDSLNSSGSYHRAEPVYLENQEAALFFGKLGFPIKLGETGAYVGLSSIPENYNPDINMNEKVAGAVFRVADVYDEFRLNFGRAPDAEEMETLVSEIREKSYRDDAVGVIWDGIEDFFENEANDIIDTLHDERGYDVKPETKIEKTVTESGPKIKVRKAKEKDVDAGYGR